MGNAMQKKDLAMSDRARILAEALPYIRRSHGKTIVIKYGGSATGSPGERTFAMDVVLLRYVGMNPIIVHGGGKEISTALASFGKETRFHDGLRITDAETIGIVEMVLTGKVGRRIVSDINQAGGQAVGLSGKDGQLIHARKIELPQEEVDLGFVGEVESVRPAVIEAVIGAGMIPVVAPLGTDSQGRTWNINADSVAGALAAALQAEKLVVLTDTPGILRQRDDDTSLLHSISLADIESLKAQGVISGGMIPKVEACQTALKAGVRKAHIIDGRIEHALLLELLTDTGVGTEIVP